MYEKDKGDDFLNNNHLKMLIASAMGAGLIAVLAQLTIPFPIVPNTAQPLAIGLVATILGKRYGAISAFIYVLLGAIGMPVFAGMSGGIGIILGPTGGYIFGFIVASFVIGFYTEKIGDSPIHTAIANVIGTAIILTMGMIQLKFFIDVPWSAAFVTGIMPFIITNPIQAILASIIGLKVKRQLRAAGVMQFT